MSHSKKQLENFRIISGNIISIKFNFIRLKNYLRKLVASPTIDLIFEDIEKNYKEIIETINKEIDIFYKEGEK